MGLWNFRVTGLERVRVIWLGPGQSCEFRVMIKDLGLALV